MRKKAMTWWIDAHRVTGDPYLSGSVGDAISDWGGYLVVAIHKGTIIVSAYNEDTVRTDDPDYEWSIERNGPVRLDGALDEAFRFIMGSALKDRPALTKSRSTQG